MFCKCVLEELFGRGAKTRRGYWSCQRAQSSQIVRPLQGQQWRRSLLPGPWLVNPKGVFFRCFGVQPRTPVGNGSRFGVIYYSYAKGGDVTPSRPCGRKRSPARLYPGLAVDSKGRHPGGWASATRAHT